MTRSIAIGVIAVAIFSLWVWRSQLFTVSRPGEAPRALTLVPAEERREAAFDVVLPAVPAGMQRIRPGRGVLLVHYWAPWERHSAEQAAALDSLVHFEMARGLEAVVVCFDPFPSVARYVARHRLRLGVLLDLRHELRGTLPCPSVPFTYVFDREGRVAVAQAGEIDWLADETKRTLESLLVLSAPAPRRAERTLREDPPPAEHAIVARAGNGGMHPGDDHPAVVRTSRTALHAGMAAPRGGHSQANRSEISASR